MFLSETNEDTSFKIVKNYKAFDIYVVGDLENFTVFSLPKANCKLSHNKKID